MTTRFTWLIDKHDTETYPDFNVEYFPFQVDGKSLQGDTPTRLVDVKNAVVT